jgi:hypothetical protein
MAVTYELYEYDASMDDAVLKSLGVYGMFEQLAHDISAREELDVLQDAPSQTVGRSANEFPERVRELTDSLTKVDETYLSAVETAAEESSVDTDRAEQVTGWLRSRKGSTVFIVGL